MAMADWRALHVNCRSALGLGGNPMNASGQPMQIANGPDNSRANSLPQESVLAGHSRSGLGELSCGRCGAQHARSGNAEEDDRQHHVVGEVRAEDQTDAADDCRNRGVQTTLAGLVRVARVEGHGDDGDAIRNSGQQTDIQRIGNTRAFDDRRHPERQAVEPGVERQQDQHQQPHAAIEEHLAQARRLAFAVGLQIGLEQGLLFGRQPLGRINVVGHERQHHERHDYRGNAFDDQQPLPAGHALHALHSGHQPAGNHAAQRQADRHRHQETRQDTALTA
nr:hypothetical protein [Tanacetum cinerariifolium]